MTQHDTQIYFHMRFQRLLKFPSKVTVKSLMQKI